jgi:hypothetical protein
LFILASCISQPIPIIDAQRARIADKSLNKNIRMFRKNFAIHQSLILNNNNKIEPNMIRGDRWKIIFANIPYLCSMRFSFCL